MSNSRWALQRGDGMYYMDAYSASSKVSEARLFKRERDARSIRSRLLNDETWSRTWTGLEVVELVGAVPRPSEVRDAFLSWRPDYKAPRRS